MITLHTALLLLLFLFIFMHITCNNCPLLRPYADQFGRSATLETSINSLRLRSYFNNPYCDIIYKLWSMFVKLTSSCFQYLKLQLNEEGHTLKAIQTIWGSTSAAGNSNFVFHPSPLNPMECQTEPVLQIGYTFFLFFKCINSWLRWYQFMFGTTSTYWWVQQHSR